MGGVVSNKKDNNTEKTRKFLKELEAQKAREVTVLLLGTSDSGKSTIAKQIRFLIENGPTRDRYLPYKPVVHGNAIQSVQDILRAMDHLQIKYSNPDLMEDAKRVLTTVDYYDCELDQDLAIVIGRLWEDPGVQECFRRSREYQLRDSAEYYLNSLDRISEPSYIPDIQDILRARNKTTGISVADFEYKNSPFKIIDVGGTRSERKKWFHVLEGVTVVIFVVAMSEYDLVLVEDQTVNRMTESLKLFESICKNRHFKEVPIVLFLNKKDLFEEKIKHSSLSVCFPEYTGKNNFNEASRYIQMQFENLNSGENRWMYTHFTCATDPIDMQYLLDAVTDIIIKHNVQTFDPL